MDSAFLKQKLGFEETLISIDIDKAGKISFSMPEHLKNKKGIYVFVLGEKFPRLKGETDILYIGSTTRTYGERLSQYINPDVEGRQRTNRRINNGLRRLLQNGKLVFLLFKPMEDNPRIKELENQLIEMFEKEHWELPPYNHQSGG